MSKLTFADIKRAVGEMWDGARAAPEVVMDGSDLRLKHQSGKSVLVFLKRSDLMLSIDDFKERLLAQPITALKGAVG